MNRWVFIGLLLVLQSFFTQTAVGQSAETTLSSDLTLQLNQNGEGSAFQQVTFSGLNEPLGNVVVTLPFMKVENISAAYDDGIALPFERLQDASDFVALQLNFQRSPNNGQHKAVIEYVVPKAMNELKQVQVPNLSQSLPVKSNTVRVMVPLAVGVVTSLGVSPDKEGLSVGSQEFVFNLSQHDTGIVLSAARDVTYGLKFEQTVNNTSFLPKRVYLVLPPDLHNQIVIYRDITPKPQNVRLDEEGNVLAQFLLWPRQSKDVSVSLDISTSKLQYDFGKVEPLENTPDSIAEKYTRNRGVWRKSSALETFVSEAVAEGQSSPIKIVEEIHDYIIENLEPGERDGRISAEQILARDGTFSDVNYSDLLVAALRFRGVPARLIIGQRYDPGALDKNLRDHSWVEVYMPGVGWVSIDPFYGEDTDIFGVSDVGKIGLFVGSDNGNLKDTVRATDSFSKRSIFIQDTENKLTTGKPELQVSAGKYALLPGLSLLKTDVQVNGGVAVDDIAYSANKNSNSHEFLGSLAPFQQRTVFGWSLLGNAFTASKVSVGYGTFETLNETTAQTESVISYIPMVVFFVIVVLIGAFLWWRRKHPKVKKQSIHVDNNGEDVQSENLLDLHKEADGSNKVEQRDKDTHDE